MRRADQEQSWLCFTHVKHRKTGLDSNTAAPVTQHALTATDSPDWNTSTSIRHKLKRRVKSVTPGSERPCAATEQRADSSSLLQPAAAAATWRCCQGGNFAAYRQTFEMLSLSQLLSDAVSKNTRMADRATMPNSWRGKPCSKKKTRLQLKRLPSPYKVPYLDLPCPAHLGSRSHLSTKICIWPDPHLQMTPGGRSVIKLKKKKMKIKINFKKAHTKRPDAFYWIIGISTIYKP